MIERLTRKSIRNFKPYTVNETEAKIRLDANESPFDISDAVKQRIHAMIEDKTGINRYPDTSSIKLRETIAGQYGFGIENIVAGSGSDQLISSIINAFADYGDKVLIPAPTFEMFRVYSEIGFAETMEFDLDPDEDYAYDASMISTMVKKHRPKLLFLCSPNNPTGNSLGRPSVGSIMESAADTIVVIDEAYADFAADSFVKDVVRYDNAVVLRTFSKAYGLAGLRCGYSVSGTRAADQIRKVLPPYNISRFTQEVARFVLEDKAESARRIRYISGERDRLIGTLGRIRQLKVYPSEANFFLVRSLTGLDLYKELLEMDIRIRGFSGKRLLEDCYRINVGSREENDALTEGIFRIYR